MLKRLVLICVLLIPASSQAILLGNHQFTLDLVGSTQYFEFAEFQEHQFPVQGLKWGFNNFTDLFDTENLDPDLPLDPNDPNYYLQNRNLISMEFVGNLDIGARLRTALSPRWGVEGYIKYTPVDLVIKYNGNELPEASFTRYSGVTNPSSPENLWNWVKGDYPTYHILRFGVNLDYVYFRSKDNTMNLYGALGAGAVSYFIKGSLPVPTDYDDEIQDVPSAPENIAFYLPDDTFYSASAGTGATVFLHRIFGINLDLRATYTPFELKRANFSKENHWILSGSIGYVVRFG